MRISKLIPALAVPLLVLGCTESPTGTVIDEAPLFAMGGSSGPSVNGQGLMIYDDMRCPSVFHAREYNDGAVKGTLQSNCPAQDINAHAQLDCMVADGNTAILGGLLTKVTTGPLTPDWFTADVGTRFWLKVRDNGEGSNAPPDEWTDWYPALPQFGLYSSVCGDTPWIDDPFVPDLVPSEGANIQVKP